jgi:RNA polymerase sigma-54 factor
MLGLKIEIKSTIRQQLLMTTSMQQALRILQLPVFELAEWVREEVEKNPLLSYEEMPSYRMPNYSQKGASQEEQLASPLPSLFEHLMHQAKESFSTQEELDLAEWIIGNLDERGFLSNPVPKEAGPVLARIQSFDPLGIAASTLQESLLLQLQFLGKEETLAYQMIKGCFDDFLHHRLSSLVKNLKCSLKEIQRIIHEEIVKLDFHPGYRFRKETLQTIHPDVTLSKEGEEWSVEINESLLPSFKISTPQGAESALFRPYLISARLLIDSLQRRKETLKKIALYLLHKQHAYFNGLKNRLVPMNVREVALELNLHTSTISRALVHKYLSCPYGIFPLRQFFTLSTPSFSREPGGVSNQSVKKKISELVEREDKTIPLSDEILMKKLHALGLSCARRTITKYRNALHIPPASLRRLQR